MAYRSTHGKSGSRVYTIWAGMIQRCENPDNGVYDYYGGRGITVCESWRKFENFYADMGDPPEGMSIDRINGDGNYEPGNCRWATDEEQYANRRPAEPGKKPGKKTSVYLSAETDERVRQADVSLPELIRRGLDAIEPGPFESFTPDLEAMLRRVLREELAALTPVAALQEQPQTARKHAVTCKCGICRPKNGGQ